MLHRPIQCRRPGAILVEAAVVYPILLILLLGVFVVGLGVFRYQQVASLAHEGARYAAVRGSQFAADTGLAAATTSTISAYVKGKAVGMHTNSLTVATTWNTSNALTHTASGSTIKNTVTVTVSYPWLPEAYFGSHTLTSTSVMTMSY